MSDRQYFFKPELLVFFINYFFYSCSVLQPLFPSFFHLTFLRSLLHISFASSALCHLLLPLREFIIGNHVLDFSHLFPKQYSAELPLSKPDNNYFVMYLLSHAECMNICLLLESSNYSVIISPIHDHKVEV